MHAQVVGAACGARTVTQGTVSVKIGYGDCGDGSVGGDESGPSIVIQNDPETVDGTVDGDELDSVQETMVCCSGKTMEHGSGVEEIDAAIVCAVTDEATHDQRYHPGSYQGEECLGVPTR